MASSNLTAVADIPERAEAVPPLWNTRYATYNANFTRLNDYLTLPDDSRTVTALSTYLDNNKVFNVKDYGATGDGSTNDTAAIEATLTAATAGSTVYFPDGTYVCVGEITVSKRVTVRGEPGAKLDFSTDAADQGVRVTASGVTIEGLEIEGPQKAALTTTQTGIYAEGASSAAYISDITIRRCNIHDFGYSGITLLFVEDFRIEKCTIHDNYRTGIECLSSRNGWIERNRVRDMIADGVSGTNAYGITCTKNNGIEQTFPRCENITVAENIVSGMSTWEGLDTHGGRAIGFVNNTITDCMIGIAITRYDDGVTFIGADNCVAIGNAIRRDSMSSTAIRNAIDCTGPITSLANWQTGNVIQGNTIRGYGKSNITFGNAEGAAIYCYAYKDLTIANNAVVESGTHGILLDFMGNTNVRGNSIRSIGSTAGSAFHFRRQTGPATGQVAENIIDVDGLTAFYIHDSMTSLNLLYNDIVSATTHYDQNGGVLALQFAGTCKGVASGVTTWDPGSLVSASSTSVTIPGVPGCSGNASAAITVDRDLQGLTLQPLTAATDTSVGEIVLFLFNNSDHTVNLAELQIRYEVNIYR